MVQYLFVIDNKISIVEQQFMIVIFRYVVNVEVTLNKNNWFKESWYR